MTVARTPKVLIVDDDPDCVDALRDVLEDMGYGVAVAGNGREALERFHSEGPPCVVILDLMMPVMDGIEFLAHREKDPVLANTPVVVVTATDKKVQGRRDLVLRKPVDFERLINAIKSACGPACLNGGTA
jgi:CheY-like chemotaxis protein